MRIIMMERDIRQIRSPHTSQLFRLPHFANHPLFPVCLECLEESFIAYEDKMETTHTYHQCGWHSWAVNKQEVAWGKGEERKWWEYHECCYFRTCFQKLCFNSDAELENWHESIKQQFLHLFSLLLLSSVLFRLKFFSKPLTDFLINKHCNVVAILL